MQTLEIKPGKVIPSSLNSTNVVLLPGDHLPIPKANWKGVILRAKEPGTAKIVGNAEFGIRLSDGCEDVALSGLKVTVKGHGMRATQTKNLLIENCDFSRNGVEGIHIGEGVTSLLIANCTCNENGRDGTYTGGGRTYHLHMCHGLYLCSEGEVNDFTGIGNGGCGIHANGASLGFWIDGIKVRGFLLESNGDTSSGTPAIQLTAVRNSTFDEGQLRANNACFTFWGEGKPTWASHGNRFRHIRLQGIPGKFVVNEGDGANDNLFIRCTGFPAGSLTEGTDADWPTDGTVPVTPAPSPIPITPPPADPRWEEVRARLDAAEAHRKDAMDSLADMDRELAAARLVVGG